MAKNPNSPKEVLEAATADPKDQRIAELEAKLAEFRGDNVVEPEFGGEVPRYRVVGAKGVFLEDDTLHEEGDEIEYLGEPNLDMAPLNDPAKKRMADLIERLTEGSRAAAEANGRPFRGLILDHGTVIATALADSRRAAGNATLGNMPVIASPKADAPRAPMMPHMATDAQRRASPKAQKVRDVKARAAPGKAQPQPMRVMGRDGPVTAGT